MATTINTTQARANLYHLIDETAKSHIPITIRGKKNSAVLLAESDWRTIQETLYLCSISGMRESIIEGLKTPIEDCTTTIDW